MNIRVGAWIVTGALVAGCPSSPVPFEGEEAGGDCDDGQSEIGPDGESDNDEGDVPAEDEAALDEAGAETTRDVSRDEGVSPDFGDPIPVPAVCGDSVIDPGEECDDGNRRNDDGCDWECRLGFGDFEYPLPDPEAPSITPVMPPTAVSAAGELEASLMFLYGGTACGGLRLRAGADRFALAYGFDHPHLGMRLRVLDASGAAVGSAWSHETPWLLQQLALAWSGAEFALFAATPIDPLTRSRFDSDGTPTEELLELREPYPSGSSDYEPLWKLGGAAWHDPVWLVAGTITWHGWSLETYRADGSLNRRGVADLHMQTGCIEAAATPTGFAVADGDAVVALDTELAILSWSGGLRSGRSGAGAVDVTAHDVWVAWQEWTDSAFPGRRQLWVQAFDFDGTPRFPSRVVYGPYYAAWTEAGAHPAGSAEVAIAHGPAGAAVVFWEGQGATEPDGWVKILTVDDWGNVISPPQSVLDADAVTPFGWMVAIDGHGDDYGVVTAVPGDLLGTMRLVFRGYAGAP